MFSVLRQRDPDRAVRALDQLRGMDPDLERMHVALGGAEEVTRFSPERWQRRCDASASSKIQHVDRVTLECRELARRAAATLQYEEPAPAELSAAMERLAEVIRLLGQEARKRGPFEQTRDAALDVPGRSGAARA